jgi:hypothetical protein
MLQAIPTFRLFSPMIKGYVATVERAKILDRTEPMGAVGAPGRASGLSSAPESPFFLGHGNAEGIQCEFNMAGRGPEQ